MNNKVMEQILENQVALMELMLPMENSKEIDDTVKRCKSRVKDSKKLLDKLRRNQSETPL